MLIPQGGKKVVFNDGKEVDNFHWASGYPSTAVSADKIILYVAPDGDSGLQNIEEYTYNPPLCQLKFNNF